jgi:hypothetical protein
MAPIDDPTPKNITKSKFGWTIIVFIIAIIFVGILVVWQLFGLSPQTWCNIAEEGDANVRGACLSVILKLLDVKDHAIIGLMSILGITVVSIVAVALNVRIAAGGPGNTSVNIGADDNDQVDVNIQQKEDPNK